MSEKREGALFYDKESGRYDIRFGLDSFYGGLHCGDCFRYYKNGWTDVRLEYHEDEWVLVCHREHLPIQYGTQVNI